MASLWRASKWLLIGLNWSIIYPIIWYNKNLTHIIRNCFNLLSRKYMCTTYNCIKLYRLLVILPVDMYILQHIVYWNWISLLLEVYANFKLVKKKNNFTLQRCWNTIKRFNLPNSGKIFKKTLVQTGTKCSRLSSQYVLLIPYLFMHIFRSYQALECWINSDGQKIP